MASHDRRNEDPADRIAIRVEPDGLAAWVTIAPGPAQPLDALRSRLAEEGIVAGIDEAVVATVAAALARDDVGESDPAASSDTPRVDTTDAPNTDPTPASSERSPDENTAGSDYCIARGRPAVDATPDELVLIDPLGPLPGQLRDDDSFDYRERGLIVPVEEGDELGLVVPGRAGEAGFTVRGAELPPRPTKPLVFACGDGIVLEADGVLRATRSGARTRKKDGVLDVVALHVHPAPVDLASGNLVTEGSLQIARDVAEGMSVRAGDDVEIRGTVDAARVEAGGSIEIRGGVIGAGKGRVRARGDLAVGHALGANLVAGGTLTVAKSVHASTLHAREIEIRGSILGDRAQAERRIRVRDAGSPNGMACVLRVAHPLEDFDDEDAGPGAARERARAVLRGGGGEKLASRKSRETEKGRGERPTAATEREIASRRSFRLRERELQKDARIEIQGTAHPGCRIDFGGRPLVLERAVSRKVFRLDPERDEIVAEESRS